ncbi:hypothetical protein BME99_27215 [Pseudomonas protegens]|nr:hypothetical protein BME99_27215 [Pseudomonas protegens]
MEFRLVRVAFFQAGEESSTDSIMGSLGKFIVVKKRFARDFINSIRTATAQNVADMNLNGAININSPVLQVFYAPNW